MTGIETMSVRFVMNNDGGRELTMADNGCQQLQPYSIKWIVLVEGIHSQLGIWQRGAKGGTTPNRRGKKAPHRTSFCKVVSSVGALHSFVRGLLSMEKGRQLPCVMIQLIFYNNACARSAQQWTQSRRKVVRDTRNLLIAWESCAYIHSKPKPNTISLIMAAQIYVWSSTVADVV